MKILIVDDMAANRELLEAVFRNSGYETAAAADGVEALNLLKRDTFQLIVSDILMPGMDGFQLCRACKTDADLRKIPFVIYTSTYTNPRDEEFARRLGADDFIIKPLELRTLLESIRKTMERSDQEKTPAPELFLDEKAFAAAHAERVAQKLTKKVAELEATRGALEDAQEQYRLLVEDILDLVLSIDGKGVLTYVSPAAEAMFGYRPEEVMGRRFEEFVFPEDLPIVRNAFRRRMGGLIDAIEYRVSTKSGEIKWVRSLSRPLFQDSLFIGLRGVVTDITERKRAEEQLRESLEQLRRAVETTIKVLVMAVEVKDPYTAGHQRRMTNLARTMATEMGLPPEKIEGLRMAGVIHDIGKITLPTEILSKPTKLSAIEFSLIREHVRLGYDILKDVESHWPLAEIVLQHHERMDGSGYPRGLKGEEILIEARILAVADVVEAMASHRPYRPALGIDAALEEIEKNRGTLYDEAVVDDCLRLFREKGYRFAER